MFQKRCQSQPDTQRMVVQQGTKLFGSHGFQLPAVESDELLEQRLGFGDGERGELDQGGAGAAGDGRIVGSDQELGEAGGDEGQDSDIGQVIQDHQGALEGQELSEGAHGIGLELPDECGATELSRQAEGDEERVEGAGGNPEDTIGKSFLEGMCEGGG